MTAVHERNLVRRVKRGCEASARELLEAHAGFIYLKALHYSRVEGIELDDALQEAKAGFIHGAKRFDTKSGNRLLTYATHWIQHYCNRSVQNSVGDIRTPVHAQEKIKKATGRFSPIRAKRFDAVVHADDGATLLDVTAGNDVLPEDSAAESQRQAKIKAAYQAAIATLDPLDRAIATERLSRSNVEKTTLREIGERFGISREWVRQVERSVAAKLRLRVARMGGKALLAA